MEEPWWQDTARELDKTRDIESVGVSINLFNFLFFFIFRIIMRECVCGFV